MLINKKCVHCGRDFTPIHPDQITCSAECRTAYKTARRHALRNELPVPPSAKKPTTLCAKCAKVTKDVCAWCRDSKPVEGWEAIRTQHRSKHGKCKQVYEGYCVVSCPEYIRG